ncbi:hypothetical protein VNO77_33782 [Canavalia gladiata]|uniref:Uncharacterized protein n=1 Tax=Canavalia gladiata TaxID=3824 RepID=A0AAN9PWP3_CANGL
MGVYAFISLSPPLPLTHYPLFKPHTSDNSSSFMTSSYWEMTFLQLLEGSITMRDTKTFFTQIKCKKQHQQGLAQERLMQNPALKLMFFVACSSFYLILITIIGQSCGESLFSRKLFVWISNMLGKSRQLYGLVTESYSKLPTIRYL